MSLTPGDTYISTLATYISTNSTRLASSPLPQPTRRPPAASSSSSSYTSYLLPPALYAGTPPKPLALRLTPQNLFYLLLRFQAIGLDVGELDVPLGKDVQRAMSLVELSGADIARRRREERRSETGSFRSVAGSMVSGLSLGGWWGTGGKVKDPDADLKLIYSAFTKLPSIVLHAAGLQDEVIEEMAGSGPLDTAVPLKVFKNLQVLEIISLPPSALMIPVSHTLRSLTIRGVDSPMNDEEGEWLIPVLFGEKEGVLEQRRRERLVGPGARVGARSRQPSAASAVMGGVGEDDEDEEEADLAKGDASGGDLLKPPSAESSGLLPSPSSLDPPASPSSSQQLKFPHLSHLALPSLSLLTLPPLPIASLVSLDLSHNLLLTLPPNLVHFPNLLTLNLEGNMINSLRGADQVLPSAPTVAASNAPPSSYRNGGTPSRLARPPPSRTGLKVLNLDSNRISNLHGLSGLTTLQRLSLRNNSISESLELSRLSSLPVLVDLYVLPNPFITNASEEDWRVRLWDGLAREGREETACPKVDGEGVTWSERRRMKAPFPTDGGAANRRASRAELEAPKSPPIVPVGGTPIQHSRKSSGRTPGSSRLVGSASGDMMAAATSSPAPSAAKAKAPPSSYHPPASSQTLSPNSAAPPRRKRRHRRIVNLDGGEDSGTATGTDVSEDETASIRASRTNGARHLRSTSEKKSTAVAAQEVLLAVPSAVPDANPSPTSSTGPPPAEPTTPNHSSLRSPPTSTTRASARRTRVSASVYEPSTSSANDPLPGVRPPSPPHGASSGDEFRKKLEAMRLEVGDSWLRVLSAGGTGAEASPPVSGAEDRRPADQPRAEGEPSVAAAEEVGVTRVVKKVKKKKKAGAASKKPAEAEVAGEGGNGV